MVPLVLLPMNTRRQDVMIVVNEEVACLVGGNPLSKCAFYKMWQEDLHMYKYHPTQDSPNVKTVGSIELV